jgi:hypothetical protein
VRLRQVLATFKPVRPPMRVIIVGIIIFCFLLCGFTWTWFIEFTSRVIFPFGDATDTTMISQFKGFVNDDDLIIYLNEPIIADQIVTGIQANSSADVYSNIEVPEMREQTPGEKIIRIIFDRLLK